MPDDFELPEGWVELGMIEEDSPEIIFDRLNEYVARNFGVVREEIHSNGARFGELRRIRDEPFTLERRHTHCTCARLGILDPTVIPVMVYSRDCGLLAHRLRANPPRQEP